MVLGGVRLAERRIGLLTAHKEVREVDESHRLALKHLVGAAERGDR